jgi:WD40 repeat protein
MIRRHGVFILTRVISLVVVGSAFWYWQNEADVPAAVFKHKGSSGVNALGYLASRNLAVIATHDGVIRLWNSDTSELIAELDEKAGPVGSLAIDPKEKWIVAIYGNGVLCKWIVEKKLVEVRQRVPELLFDFRNMVVAPDGDTLAVTAKDHSVRIWRIANLNEIKKLEGHHAQVETVAIMKDGSKLVSGDIKGNVIIWDIKSGAIDHRFRAHERQVHDLLFLGESSAFASAGEDETIAIWDARSAKLQTRLRRDDMGSVWRLALSPDGKTLASADVNANVAIWDTKTWERKRWFGAHFATILGLTFNKDGNRLITSCAGGDFQDRAVDGEVKVWKVK